MGVVSGLAIVTVEDGVELIPVLELEGMLVEARSLLPVDLVSVVVVVGLEELSAA